MFVENKNKRRITKKRNFDESVVESREQVNELSPQESFKVHYFVYIVDHAIISLEQKFDQYKQYGDIFGFLFSNEKLKPHELKASCKNFDIFLQNGDILDIDADDLFNELELLRKSLPVEHNTANTLNFQKMLKHLSSFLSSL